MQRIVERPQIGIHLALQIPRQKTELFPGLDRRAGQDNPAHLLIFKRRDRHGHREVGLSRSRRSHAEHDHLFPDSVHICLLSDRLWLYRLPVHSVTNAVAVDHAEGGLLLLRHQRQRVIHILLRDHIPPFCEFEQL